MEKLNLVIAFLSMLLFVHLSDSCCFPKQFEGFQEDVGVEFKTGIYSRALYEIHYDSINKKVASAGNATGILVSGQMLQDFSAKKLYVVQNGKCIVSELEGPMVVCVPGNLLKSTHYGIGNNKVDIDVYKVGNGMSMTVTRNECAIMTIRAEYKDSIADMEYRGLTLGIKDMSVFDVPKACQNGTSTSPISRMMHRMMETRHSVFLRHH